MKQETDKSAAVATVVAAVDMARVREPGISAVEQTVQRTTTTAMHIPPAQDQVSAAGQTGRGGMSQCPPLSEDDAQPSMALTFRTCLPKGGLRDQRCATPKTLKDLVSVTQVGSQELTFRKSTRRSDRYLKYHYGPGAGWAQGGLDWH